MFTSAAWPSVVFTGEAQENEYFAPEKRTKFLLCVKTYGNHMRSIHISFGYAIGRSGQRILTAVANHCKNLRSFLFCTSETQEFSTPSELLLKRGDVAGFVNILKACSDLNDVHLIDPHISWSDPADSGTNIILELTRLGLAGKITELRLKSSSLTDHEGYLNLLDHFTHLRHLSVYREKINDGLLLSLVRRGLQDVCLYQEEELALEDSQQLQEDVWEEVHRINPHFRIDLVLRYIHIIKDMFVKNMPIRSLILDDLVNIVTKGVMVHLIENYQHTLESFTYTNLYLEHFESGDTRLPAVLIQMAATCTKLRSLKYGFPLSSTTILLLVKARKFSEFVIPSVEVSYEFDLPESQVEEQWGGETVRWVKAHYGSERRLEQAVSHMLGFPWTLQDAPIRAMDI